MVIFDNESDAKKAIMKLIPLFTKGVKGLDKVELRDFKRYDNNPPNTYYTGFTFYVDGDSFDEDTSDRLHALKNVLIDASKKYLGINLLANSSQVTTLNSTIE